MWSVLCTDFDPEEETANFGVTRAALQAKGGELYDVVTFATLEPKDTPIGYPRIVSRANDVQTLALALDQCLHVIYPSEGQEGRGPQDGSTPSFSLIFSAPVQALAWSPCGQFLVAGLAGGWVQMVHLSTQLALPPFSLSEPENNRAEGTPGLTIVECQATPHRGGGLDLELVTQSGWVFEIHSLDMVSLDRAILSRDMEAMRAFQNGLRVESRRLVDHEILDSMDMGPGQARIVSAPARLCQIGRGYLPMDYLATNERPDPKLLKTSRVLRNVVFCLDNCGQLHMICLHSLITLQVWAQERVLDFVLMEDAGDLKIKMIMIVESQTDPDQHRLQMREHPTFELLYELQVSKFTRLIDFDVNQETPMFLEGTLDPTNPDKPVTFLRMRGICESVLEARLHRLIRRNKFEEALNFAKNFKLPFQDVYQAKIAWILERLSPWREEAMDPSANEELLEDLKATLGKITDLDYVVQCCINAALSNLDDVKDLLFLARTIIQNNVDKELSLQLMISVSRTLQRLETFKMAFYESSVEDWMAFARADLYQIFLNLVQDAKLEQSLIIWNRHKPEFYAEEFQRHQVLECLESVPKSWRVEQKLTWLQQFIPDCLEMCPESLGEIALWACKTALAYEVEERKVWPENGLQLTRGILKTLCFTSDDQETDLKTVKAQLVLNCQRSNPMSELARLIGLSEDLEDLKTLHCDHRLRVKYDEFANEDKMSVVTLLLDWLSCKDEIKTLVDGFLLDFIGRFNLGSSEVFASYMSELIQTTEFSWHWHFGETPWEAKAAALIQYIESIDHKAKLILEIAKCAPVPWSIPIRSICDIGMKLNHPLAYPISEQSKMVALKQILRKYDCRTLGLTGFRSLKLLQFMVKSKGQEGFEDALEFAKFSVDAKEGDTYRVYIKHLLIEHDDSKAAMGVFREFMARSSVDAQDSAEIILTWAELIFSHKINFFNDSILSFLFSLVRVLNSSSDSDFVQRAQVLKRRSQLLKEFNIKINFRNKTKLKAGIQNYFKTKIAQSDMDTKALSLVYKNVLRLRELTSLPTAMLLKILLDVLSKHGNEELTVQLSLALQQSKGDMGHDLVEHMKSIIGVMNNHLSNCDGAVDLPHTLRGLSGHCLLNASPSDLVKVAYLNRWQYHLERIHHQMHKNLALARIDQDKKLTLADKLVVCYKDKGLPLDKSLYTIINECIQVWNNTNLSVAQAISTITYQGSKLCIQLQNLGHVDLSMSFRLLLGDISLHLALKSGDEDMIQNLITGHTASFQVKSLLPKLLSEKRPDFILALAYLLGDAKSKSLVDLAHVNSNLGLEYTKLIALAQLGIEFSRLWNLVAPLDNFKTLLVQASWGKFATDHGIQFKDCFSGGKSELSGIIKTFAQKPAISLESIVCFCRAFDIKLASAMITFIRVSLTGLEPIVCKVEKKVEKADNFDQVIDRVEKAFHHLESGNDCLNLLLELFDEVNPYNYEVQGLIVEKLQWLSSIANVCDEKRCDMIVRSSQCLGFLLQYERVGDLTETEIDTWYEHRSGAISPVSQFRLPFTWLVTLKGKEKYKILRNEFQLSNYGLWSNIAGVLKLTTDNICMQTVQNAIGSISNSQQILDSETEWSLHLKHKATMVNIHACLGSMQDPFKATSCAHWVVNHLPGGADKLLAAEGSQLIAKNWYDNAGDEGAEMGHSLATMTLLRLQVTNALYKHSLNSKEYLDLATHGEGKDIIFKVYEDPSIVERSQVAGGRFPAINCAAQEIATIYGESIQRIKYDLLDMWLPASQDHDQCNLDETITNFKLIFNKKPEESKTNLNGDNFLRCVYLAQDGNEEVFNYLLNKGFSKSPMVHTMHKFRALKCLLAVADESSIEACTSMSCAQVRLHMQNLYFVARLEKLNLPYDVDAFQDADKVALVESVLRSCAHNTSGILVLVELCIHFKIYPPNLWISLLEHMEQLSMTGPLTSTLMELNQQPHLWHFPAFVSAWNSLILRPFHEAPDPSASEDARIRCEKSLQMISCCPIANSLELEAIQAHCTRLQLDDLAEKYSFLFANQR
eukprot:maker-scaffold515_size150689-snap-gene-0.33 protein:Tk06550 transcript:maker-scaffold515_size150689-snap-gene-0.33-mRNA-1 annotation:"kinetochore-associated protein 1"